MTTPSLLNWIMDLLRNDHAREAFQANPQAAMASAGLTASCGQDVKDATPFIVDHPGVKWSQHEDHNHHAMQHHHHDDDDAVKHIQHIVNNYTYNIENNYDIDVDGDGGDDDGGIQIAGTPGGGDGDNQITDSTLTDSLNHTETSEANGNAATGGTVVDQSGSTVGDDQVGRDDIDVTNTMGDGSNGRDDNSVAVNGDGNVGGNAVDGDGSAGRDIVTTTGDDSVNADGDVDHTEGGLAGLDHTVETGDIHVLSDLVNVDDTLNDSLNGSLNDLSVLNDFDHLLDVTGPLL